MLNNISNTLKLQPEQDTNKYLYLYILMAYLFGISIRLILLYQVKDISSLWMDDVPLPVWTADAGLHGFHAKEIMAGVSYPLTSKYIPGYLIAGVTTIFNANIDWVMVLLPIFLAPLIAIPIILFGKALKLTQFGFLSALAALAAINYYMRSYLGYMDTDIINIFFILMITYFMIKALQSNNLLYALGGGISILVFTIWYHASSSINLALVGTFFAIVLLFYRHKITNFQALIIFSIVLIPYDPIILITMLLITLLLFTVLNKYRTFSYWYYVTVLLIGILLILPLFDLSHYYHRATQYFNSDTLNTFEGNGITYYYTSFLQYISEVQKAYFWESQPGMSGMLPYTLLATFGYMLLGIAYPQTLIFLPLLLLGYLSPIIGIRFSFYASPVLSFGIIYLLFIICKIIMHKYSTVNPKSFIYFSSSIIFIFMLNNILLYNNILKKNLYPLFKSEESILLKEFSKKLSKDDKIIASWELGYPLWYYTGYKNTLTDNALHGGPDTHAIAKIFMSHSQKFSANTSKYLSAKFVESTQDNSLFILPYLARSQDLNILFNTLEDSLPSIQSKGDSYILVHGNMLNYISIFSDFASKNMKTGEGKGSEKFAAFQLDDFYLSDANATIGIPFIFDHKKGEFTLPFNNINQKINKVITIEAHEKKKEYSFHADSSYYLIAEEDKYLFYLHSSVLKSFLIQAFLLDNYDRKYFEKVGETNKIKIFKVK